MRSIFFAVFIILSSLKAFAGEAVFEFKGKSLDNIPCQVTVVRRDDGLVRFSISERRNFLLRKNLSYNFTAEKVANALAGRAFNDRIMIKQDYGTPSREAFTRFELVFTGDVLREVYALKYKNLNYKTKSKYLSCKF